MQEHELEQLLNRTADADARVDSTVSPEALANRARVLVRRHRRIRATAAATTGLAMLLLLASLSGNQRPANKTDEPVIAQGKDVQPPEVDYALQIKQLRQQADHRMRLVKAMQAAVAPRREAMPQPTRLPTRATPVMLPVEMLIEQEAEVTARVMVEQAARWMMQADRRDEGIRSYRRTVELFPTTVAAQIARNRLHEIEKRSGVAI